MSFPTLPIRDASADEWQRKAAMIVNRHSQALQASGTTRPISSLSIGQQFFDTTLGLPVWWDGTQWVTASGTAA